MCTSLRTGARRGHGNFHVKLWDLANSPLSKMQNVTSRDEFHK